MRGKTIYISVVITAIILTITYIICPICFENNDDRFIMYLTAGYSTGEPAVGTLFGGFLWSVIISLLYRLYAGLSWYAIVTLIAIAFSTLVICHGMIVSSGNKKEQKIIGVVTFVAIFFFSLMYFSVALQFTATSAIVGCAAVITAATYKYMDTRLWQILNIILSAVLIACSYSIRKQMGLVSFSAVLIILFLDFFQDIAKGNVKRTIIICIVFIITMGSNAIYEHATGIADFLDCYAPVSKWIDYPHLDISDDKEGVYASVGWDEELFSVASNWYFMDERVTKENFEIINSAYDANLTINERIERFQGLIAHSQMCTIQVLSWIILLIVFNARELVSHRLSVKAITIDAMFISFMAASFYFGIIQGKYVLRLYEGFLLVYFVPSLAIMLQMQAEASSRIKCMIPLLISLAIIASAIMYPSACMPINTYKFANDVNRREQIKQVEQLEKYAINNNDNIYVYDYNLSRPANPFTVYDERVPSNVLYWGGWTYNSPIYQQQLATNGIDHIYASDFMDGNIYLCGTAIDENIVSYMQSINSAATVEIIDEFDGIIIYNFTTE